MTANMLSRVKKPDLPTTTGWPSKTFATLAMNLLPNARMSDVNGAPAYLHKSGLEDLNLTYSVGAEACALH